MLGDKEVSVVYKGTDEVWSLGSADSYADGVFSTYLYKGTSAIGTLRTALTSLAKAAWSGLSRGIMVRHHPNRHRAGQ